jgi:hypothetical protein
MRYLLTTVMLAALLGNAHGQCLSTGQFLIEPSISYSCVGGLADWKIDILRIIDNEEGTLTATAQPGPLPTMAGLLDCNDTSFSVGGVVGGTCMESWSVEGRLDGQGNWSGTIDVSFFETIPGLCVDCLSQLWDVSATRIDLPIERRSWAAAKARF